jgi:hypothetical protein
MISGVVRPNLLRSRIANLQARNFAYMQGSLSQGVLPTSGNESLNPLGSQQSSSLTGQSLKVNDKFIETMQLITENGSNSSSLASSAVFDESSSLLVSNGVALSDSFMEDPRHLSPREVEVENDEITLKLRNPSNMDQLLEHVAAYNDYETIDEDIANHLSISESHNLSKAPNLFINLKSLEPVSTESWYDLTLKFKCSICQDVLAGPCATNCSHSYCGSCLQDYLFSSGNFDNFGEMKKCCLCKTVISNYIYERGYDEMICEQVYKLSQSAEGYENMAEWSTRRDDFFIKEKRIAEQKTKAASRNDRRRNDQPDNQIDNPEDDFFDAYGDLIFYTGAFVVLAYTAMSVIYRNKSSKK